MSRFPDLRRVLGPALRRRSVLGLAGLGLAAGAYASIGGGDLLPETARVRREELVLGVDVEGELSAVRSLEIGPPVVREMWEFKITFLAPESGQVKKGQPLVSFDPSPLQRQLEEKGAEYEEASKKIERKEVELLSQTRDLELQLAEAESRLEKARLKNNVPEDLRSRNEVLQTTLELKDAEQAMVNLKARILSVRDSEAAALRALVSQRDRAKARVTELQAAIQSMTVPASQDGIVIYKTGWRDEKKKVGDSTWFGEKLLALPDLGEMRADGDVDEADGGAIKAGQRVTLRLEALPDRDFTGTISKIARSVRRKSPRVPNKVFRVQIALDKADAALRPAMRFRGEVETGRVKGTLAIPREAVVLRPSGPVVRVKGWTGFREVPVSLGRHNKRFVEVLSGLAEGDEVATADPAEARS